MDNVQGEKRNRDNDWRLWMQKRYVVAALSFAGFFSAYLLRVNLSVAIVDMTEIKTVTLANGTIIYSREFDWDTRIQGYILGAFFYGYASTQLIGGYLGARFGGKRVFGMGIAATALLTVLTPWVARWNVYLFLILRTLEGICEMPRNYSRKTGILSYSAEDLQNAIRAIKNDGKKIREAARTFNIPESTLRKYKSRPEDLHQLPRLGRQPVFRKETENELREYILILAKLFFGLTPKGLKRLVFRYVEANNIRHNFNREEGLAGKDWLYGFLKRTPEITLRQPEGTSLNRIASFNKEAVQTFYSND
ncbi:hypothetical protein NQ318_019988 [Aromia moschata]|uniref:HTH psq-type domain-containing protein n=1 Tax=Aromia moschata TaxID=1265417 RepID=A0AAV8Y6V7_9CUCU|nr:hypothetical protein NQ318_019988 [Aromia moschata]